MKNKKKLVLFLAIIAVIVLGLQAWWDEGLFTEIKGNIKGSQVKANIIFVQDRTGSMCSIIFHPDFNSQISLSSYSTVDLPNSTSLYEGIGQTSWYIRWFKAPYSIVKSSSRVYIDSYDSGTHVLRLHSKTTYIKKDDWILQYRDDDTTIGDDDIENNINYQMVARVSAIPTAGSNYTDLTLEPATIKGTPTPGTHYYVGIYSNDTYTTKIVKLYGSTLDQGDYRVAYAMAKGSSTQTDYTYLKWIFGVANDTQRQQITDFSTLAYDIEYNGYLRTTPVPPNAAKALNPDNSDKSETLLEEWNRVMKAIYPNRIANLLSDAITGLEGMTASTTTINYKSAKDTFKNYTPGGFYIKIDAETMLVNSHTPSTDPKTPDQGQLTVTRGQNGTIAAAHPVSATIMIYNQTTSPVIDEYTPLTTPLFSSMQHVDEASGDVDPTFQDIDKIGTKDCYRYKRAFTRIQVAREALCDVVTAKNQLFKGADLAAAIDNATDTVDYCNATDDFKNKVAPFFIKVIDPADPASTEIMRVTANDPATYKLTVSRHEQGTSACAHNIYSAVMTYSGARDVVRFGIFYFPYNSTAKMLVGLNDFGQKNTDGTYKTASYINTTILDQVDKLDSSGSTPLARALSMVWNYLKPNPGSGPADYIKTGSSDDWKAIDSSTFGLNEKYEPIAGVTHPQGSPIEIYCQQNFAVMITDGDANEDSGLRNYGVFKNTIQKTTLCGKVTEYFRYDYNRNTNPTPWGDTVNDVSGEYLTDVAYFLAHQDMFPTAMIKTGNYNTINGNNYYDSGTAVADDSLYDEKNDDPLKKWPGNQYIKTFTVGLCLTNTVLPKAAKNGEGQSYTASNYRDLSEAFSSIISSVSLLQIPMTYTTYAAPKQSITGGKYGYIAHFVPDNTKAMWVGHLRRFLLGDDGNFSNNIDDQNATVLVGGTNVKSFQWDAAEILKTRTAPRMVYTSKPNGSNWERKDFMGSEITYTDLAVTSGQVSLVKNFTQNFNKADGTTDYPDSKLSETFHFNPQLVGYPLSWKANFDASYKSFYDHYAAGGAAPRTEVVYAGANDGKLHCFKAADGTELWSYVPNAHLKLLKNPALDPVPLPPNTLHNYFVDGKSLVKDIKVDSLGDYRDWKTGLFFGLGIGGRAYCALDVTTPVDGTGDAAFNVLWETNDSAETVTDGHMGYTEAKPVVVDMYAGSTLGKFPGAILPGGYNSAEVQATDMTAQDWQRREGKAFYILNAATGALVKKFVYGATDSNTPTLNVNKNFLTAMTAAPAVLDKNNDGIADVIYLAESGDYQHNHGGAIWKINCYGDPLNWQAQKIYQADAGQTIFISPSLAYDIDYRVWVMFGTGRRPHPVEGSGGVFTNKTGQFVAFIDDDSSTAKTNADLHDAVIPNPGDYTIDDGGGIVKKGFFFNFSSGTHEIMFEPQPLYINSVVYFMTLVPMLREGSEGPTEDPCGKGAANGMHYIYQFKLTSQGNTFTIGDVLIQSGKILGYGPMDDKFKIYIGKGDASNFKPDQNQGTIDLKDNYTPLLWREEKK